MSATELMARWMRPIRYQRRSGLHVPADQPCEGYRCSCEECLGLHLGHGVEWRHGSDMMQPVAVCPNCGDELLPDGTTRPAAPSGEEAT